MIVAASVPVFLILSERYAVSPVLYALTPCISTAANVVALSEKSPNMLYSTPPASAVMPSPIMIPTIAVTALLFLMTVFVILSFVIIDFIKCRQWFVFKALFCPKSALLSASIPVTMRLPVTSLLGMLVIMGAFMVLGMADLFAVMLPAFIVILVLTQIDIIEIFHEKIRPLFSRRAKKEKKQQGTGSGITANRGQFGALLEAKAVTPDRIMTAFKPFMSLTPIRKLEKYLVEKVRMAIFESGHANDSTKIAKHGIMYGIIAVPPSIVAGIVLAFLLHPGFLGLCAVPIAVMFSGLMQLKSAKSQRKAAIGHELPVFIACASIMEKVGVSFYEFIERIATSKTTLFPSLRQDAMLFQRNVQYMAMSHSTALRKVAETHPNNDFKDLVANYSAAYNTSGTNTANTMIAATESAFRVMKNSVKGYTQEANGIAQMVLLIMAMMPMLAIATTFVATGKDAVSMTVLVMLILPLIIVALLMSVDSKQPRTHNTVKMYRQPFVLAFLSVPVMVIMGVPLWGMLGVSTVVWAGSNAFFTRKHFANVSKMDSALPTFAQFVTDGRLEGMEIREAVAARAKSKDKKDALSPVLRDISKQIMFGKSLATAAEAAHTTSWLSRILFFVLSQVQESGGGDVHSLQTFTKFVKEYVESRREMISSLRGSVIMGYVIPVIMAMMLMVTSIMTSGLSDDTAQLEAMPINFPTPEQIESMADQSNFLIVECTVLIGLLVSKITYFTMKHTVHVAAMAAFGTVLCVALPYVQDIASELL